MEYVYQLAILFCIYSMLGISLNLVVGYTGLLSSTHAAFYGIGAYATAITLTAYGVNFFAGVALGIVISAGIALAIGIVLNRFSGDYYAIVSLGFNVVAYSVMLNWHELTRGPLGIPGISRPSVYGLDFSSNFMFLVLSVLFLVAVWLISRFIAMSSFGRVLKGIREDEAATQAFGYNTLYFKLAIFVVSAGIAAVAGSVFASYVTFIDPSTFTVMESVFILAIIIFGGLSSLKGSVIGALILVLLPEALRFAGFPASIAAQMRQVIYGATLIILMLFRPQGIFGEFKL